MVSGQDLGPAGGSLKLHRRTGSVWGCANLGLRWEAPGYRLPPDSHCSLFSCSVGALLNLETRPVAALRGLSVNGGEKQELEPLVSGEGPVVCVVSAAGYDSAWRSVCRF